MHAQIKAEKKQREKKIKQQNKINYLVYDEASFSRIALDIFI